MLFGFISTSESRVVIRKATQHRVLLPGSPQVNSSSCSKQTEKYKGYSNIYRASVTMWAIRLPQNSNGLGTLCHLLIEELGMYLLTVELTALRD